jgi:catechol 2,3-dioxygenase-like lactoylglutathione lyase family enzyme
MMFPLPSEVVMSPVLSINLACAALATCLLAAVQGGDSASAKAAKPPRLFRVIVPVGDLERAAAFYGELLGVEGKRVSPGRHYLDCGGVILALFDPESDGDDDVAKPLPDHVYFAVGDLEVVFARAQGLGCLSKEGGDGGLAMGEIAMRPWGERSFYCVDPFGTRLCFVDDKTLFTGR